MDGHGLRLPTNELPAERLSVEAAGGYKMFPKVGRDSLAKTALDAMNRPNCTPEAKPFTTALELEVGKDLEDKIKTTQQQAGPNNSSSSPATTTTELSEGFAAEHAGAYHNHSTSGHHSSSSPAPGIDDDEPPVERVSMGAAGGYEMFPKVGRDSLAKAALDAMNRPNCTPEANPITTMLELEVGKDLEARTNQAAGRNDSSPPAPEKTELSEGLGEQAGAYVILPTPGGHNHHNSGEAPAMNFDAIQGATAGAIQFVSGEGARGHTFAPAGHGATTTVDLARMKAGETIAEATSAAMQVGKEAGDFVAGAAGHKWF